MKTLRDVHLYLGCLFAPLLMYFSISGAWQVFRFNDLPRKGEPPSLSRSVLHALSNPHTHSTLPTLDPKVSESMAFGWLSIVMALGITATALLGILLALRYTRKRTIVWVCLVSGAVGPVMFLWLARAQ